MRKTRLDMEIREKEAKDEIRMEIYRETEMRRSSNRCGE